MSKTVLVANPTYNGTMHSGCAQALYRTGTQHRDIHVATNAMSLVSHNSNYIYAQALNKREQLNIEWFAHLHSDVSPELWWIDTLIAEAERVGADMISVFIPIKDRRGVTSTCIADPNFPWTPFTRITQKQYRHVSWPTTVDIDSAATALESLPPGLRVENVPRSCLQVNTGCCLIRLDAPWSHKVYFDQLDTIYHDGERYVAKTQSEDWRVSERIASLGGRVFVTKAVSCLHEGNATYDSSQIWGQNRDTECLEGTIDEQSEEIAA